MQGGAHDDAVRLVWVTYAGAGGIIKEKRRARRGSMRDNKLGASDGGPSNNYHTASWISICVRPRGRQLKVCGAMPQDGHAASSGSTALGMASSRAGGATSAVMTRRGLQTFARPCFDGYGVEGQASFAPGAINSKRQCEPNGDQEQGEGTHSCGSRHYLVDVVLEAEARPAATERNRPAAKQPGRWRS